MKVVYRTPRTCAQDCGVDGLYVCFGALGTRDHNLRSIEGELSPGPKGTSLDALLRLCDKFQVPARPVQFKPAIVRDFGQPMILHVNQNHYIALLGREEGDLLVFDSRAGLLKCTDGWFGSTYDWDGTALAVGPLSPYMVYALYGRWASAALAASAVFLAAWLAIARQRRSRARSAQNRISASVVPA